MGERKNIYEHEQSMSVLLLGRSKRRLYLCCSLHFERLQGHVKLYGGSLYDVEILSISGRGRVPQYSNLRQLRNDLGQQSELL